MEVELELELRSIVRRIWDDSITISKNQHRKADWRLLTSKLCSKVRSLNVSILTLE